MRSCTDIFRSLPIVHDLTDCQTFMTVATVTLADPQQFVAANSWCKCMWRHQRRKFYVVEGSRRNGPGTFKFADETHAFEFSLKFGEVG